MKTKINPTTFLIAFLSLTIFMSISFEIYPMSDNISQGSSYQQSIQWQKIELQDSIETKINTLLNRIIPQYKYIINVTADIKEPSTPNFTSNGGTGGATDNKNKEMFEENPKKKSFINPSNLTIQESKDDSIIFSKFGLEAPVVDEYIVPENKDTAKDEKNIPSKQSGLFEEAWKMNNYFDIFNNITNLTIAVTIDDIIMSKEKELVEKTLKKLDFNFGKINAQIIINYEKLQNNTFTKRTAVFDYIAKYQLLIAILLCAIIVVVSLLTLLKSNPNNRSSSAANTVVANNAANGDNNENSKNNNANKSEIKKGRTGHYKPLNGIERLKELFENNKENAIMLIKRWIKNGDNESSKKLAVIVKQLSNDDLSDILEHLSSEDRSLWKSLVDQNFPDTDLESSIDRISDDILATILLPTSRISSETYDLLLKARPDAIAKLVSNAPTIAPIILTEMTPDFTNNIISHLSDNDIEKMMENALAFEPDKNEHLYLEFTNLVYQHFNTKTTAIGLKKIKTILTEITPNKELAIYQTLIKNHQIQLAIDLANKYFPFFLFAKLQPTTMKEIFASYGMNKKIGLLYILSGNFKKLLLNIYAPENSMAADMLKLEFERIESDKKNSRELMANKNEILKDFVKFVRTKIQTTSAYAEEAEILVEEYLNLSFISEYINNENEEKYKSESVNTKDNADNLNKKITEHIKLVA